jgi:hypothetical protein
MAQASAIRRAAAIILRSKDENGFITSLEETAVSGRYRPEVVAPASPATALDG